MSYLQELPVELLTHIIEFLSINDISKIIDLLEFLNDDQAKYIIMKRFPMIFKIFSKLYSQEGPYYLSNLNIYNYTCKSWYDLFFDIIGNTFVYNNYDQAVYEYLMYYGEYFGGFNKIIERYSKYEKLDNTYGMKELNWVEFSEDSNFLIYLMILIYQNNLSKLIANGIVKDPNILLTIVKLNPQADHKLIDVIFDCYLDSTYIESILYILKSDNVICKSEKFKYSIGNRIGYIITRGLKSVLEEILEKSDYEVTQEHLYIAKSYCNYPILKMLLNHKTCKY